jgi:hypothetical protein
MRPTPTLKLTEASTGRGSGARQTFMKAAQCARFIDLLMQQPLDLLKPGVAQSETVPTAAYRQGR